VGVVTTYYPTSRLRRWLPAILLCGQLHATTFVHLTDVPDYVWYAGCFGTATGNLMGFWDRNGFPDFYTGPTGGGVAPLDSFGANSGITSLWATKAGVDGRPAGQPGHMDDYYSAYESTAADPCVLFGRAEHSPDCIGDFIGLNQRKWRNMNGECDGNIDGYCFVYWDPSGQRRVNFTPGPEAGLPAVDMQSGLRAWTQYRGYRADVATQLTEFNPDVPSGAGFTFDDLKAEIDAGYPVLLFLQDSNTKSQSLGSMPRANPPLHGMLAYGYLIEDDGTRRVEFRTSWASGDGQFNSWSGGNWLPGAFLYLPLRGVILYHPRPQIREILREPGQLRIRWDGPAANLMDEEAGTVTRVHRYVLERSTSLEGSDWQPLGDATPEHEWVVPASEGAPPGFFRVRLQTGGAP